MELLPLVWTNLMRNKLRTILTTLSVFVALFLFVLLHGITDTLTASTQVASERRLVTRNKISLVFPLPMSQYEKIKAVPGVSAVSWSNWFGGQDPVDSRGFFAQFAVDAKTYFPLYASDIEIAQASPAPAGTPVPPGVDPKLAAFMNQRDACVVGEKLLLKRGWKLGQTIHLNGTIYPGSWPYVIRAVYRPKIKALDAETMFFHWDYLYEKSNRQAQVGIFIFSLADPSQAATIGKRVDAMFENSSNATHTETERAFQAGFVSMFGNIPFVIQVIGLAVAFSIFLVAAVTMMMAIRERTNEFAVLKTLGFGDGSVFLMVLAEAGAITLTGGLAGSLLAKFLLERTGLMVPGFSTMIVRWDTVLLGIGVAVLMGAFSGLLPAWQASRLKIVDALRKVG
ncbi:MAG: FtsX-like permease family protein [Candidatus Eisenbacteria bacterium]